MFDANQLDATLADFARAAASCADRNHPGMRAGARDLNATLDAWRAAGSRLKDIEGPMRSASRLQETLYSLNPEGLPFGIRDESDAVLSLIDEAQDNGFEIEGDHLPARGGMAP